MFAQERRIQHSVLMARMAEAARVNLGAALADGDLSVPGLMTMLARCLGCRAVEECGEWLDFNPVGAPALPAFCRNRERMAELARG